MGRGKFSRQRGDGIFRVNGPDSLECVWFIHGSFRGATLQVSR